MKKVLMDSPYVYLEELQMTHQDLPQDYEKADLNKLFRDKTYGKTEYLILEALTIFHYLNKANITKYVDGRLKERKWPDYTKVINRLYTDNVLSKTTYGEHVFYGIYPYAREYMENKQTDIRKKERYFPLQQKDKVLECASLAQWHISLLSRYHAKRSCFYEKIKVSKKEFMADSYMETTIGNTHFRVLSYAFPKADKDISAFFDKLNLAWVAMNQKQAKNQVTITILVISTLKEIKALSQIMESNEHTKGRTLFYVLEGNTMEFDGLSCLYYYDTDSSTDEDTIRTITITDK